jgi:hypothetical protein
MAHAVEAVGDGAERAVARAAQAGEVSAATTDGVPGSLGEVRTVHQCLDEPRDLTRVGGAVGVDHRDDVTGR